MNKQTKPQNQTKKKKPKKKKKGKKERKKILFVSGSETIEFQS
jgi:hypothetical protein